MTLWPGVTIAFDATWVPVGRLRTQTRTTPDGDRYQVRVHTTGRVVPEWEVEAGGRWETHGGRYYFDPEAAAKSVDFFPEYLRHHIGEWAGMPFEQLEYQRKLLSLPIFGWVRATDGLRRFRRVFFFAPKGSGKSPWASGTALYLTLCDNEPAAEVYALANDKPQARVVHENAKVMVEESPDLLEVCEVFKDSIVHAASRSFLQVVSADATTKHGFRPHGAVFDEFHGQKNRDLYEAIKKSMVKRRQPLMVIVTHAGDDDEGICYEEYEYAKKVLSGTVDDEQFLPVIFEASEKDDWTDSAVHARVNPGYGITVKADAISAECREAQVEPRKLNDFLRFHLNRWVNQATAWIPVDWWDRCDEPLPPLEELVRYPCALGVDMAQKIDLAAAVLVVQLPLHPAANADGSDIEIVEVDQTTGEVKRRTKRLNYRIAVIPAFWLPEETLKERQQQDQVPYAEWARVGLLRVTEGAIIDSEAIADYVVRDPRRPDDLASRFPLLRQGELGYDPAFCTELAMSLAKRQMKTVEVPQNYTHLSEACQVFEALVKAGRVLHGGHRVLRWNVENVAVKRDDAGRIKPVKPKRQTKRIDGVSALLCGLARLMVMPTPKAPRKGIKATVISGGTMQDLSSEEARTDD